MLLVEGIDCVRLDCYNVTAVDTASTDIDSVVNGGEVVGDRSSEGEGEKEESSSVDEHGARVERDELGIKGGAVDRNLSQKVNSRRSFSVEE